jgi:RNA polymerase sigma-70 factor, ECF subfamily
MNKVDKDNVVMVEMQRKDGEAITLTLAGNKDAFAVVVARYTERAYRMALYILGSEQDAMDISQEAFIRAYRHLTKFDLSKPFFPWFARILRNLCYNYYNRRKRKMTYNIEDFQIATPANPGLNAETKMALNNALAKLSIQDREIIGKFYFEELTYAEIAEELEIPVGTVMSRLYYARKHLKKYLSPQLPKSGKEGR